MDTLLPSLYTSMQHFPSSLHFGTDVELGKTSSEGVLTCFHNLRIASVPPSFGAGMMPLLTLPLRESYSLVAGGGAEGTEGTHVRGFAS